MQLTTHKQNWSSDFQTVIPPCVGGLKGHKLTFLTVVSWEAVCRTSSCSFIAFVCLCGGGSSDLHFVSLIHTGRGSREPPAISYLNLLFLRRSLEFFLATVVGIRFLPAMTRQAKGRSLVQDFLVI